MSDTPRTDTVYNKYELHCTSEEVTELNNLARTLERENQQLRASNDQMSHDLKFIRADLNCDDSTLDVLIPAIEQLRDGFRACKEALEHQNRYWHNYTPTLIANSTLHLEIIEKALFHPAVQGLKN